MIASCLLIMNSFTCIPSVVLSRWRTEQALQLISFISNNCKTKQTLLSENIMQGLGFSDLSFTPKLVHLIQWTVKLHLSEASTGYSNTITSIIASHCCQPTTINAFSINTKTIQCIISSFSTEDFRVAITSGCLERVLHLTCYNWSTQYDFAKLKLCFLWNELKTDFSLHALEKTFVA